MSLYDLFLGGLEQESSQSLYHNLGKIVLGHIYVYDQIAAGYYDGSIVDNNNALYCAVRNRKKSMVKLFIEKGANNWSACIYSAVINGYIDIIEVFVEHDVSIKWDQYICLAAQYGYLNIFKYLLSKGSNNWNQYMCSAAHGGRLDMVDYLVSCGANDWNEAMCSAARIGYLYLVKYLVSKGANDWNRGIDCAIAHGHLQLVKYFVSKGLNDWNKYMLSAAGSGHLRLVKYLVSCGASDWCGCMHQAARGGYLDIVKYFKQKIKEELNK